MKNKPIKATVRFVDPEEADKNDRLEDYTVPIPEGLTEEFRPSKPVTPRQMIDWETKNKEPYPGYAEELFNWENAWEEVNRAQLKADGGYLHIADPVHFDDDPEAAAGSVKNVDGEEVPVYGNDHVFGEHKDTFENVFGGNDQFGAADPFSGNDGVDD
ncbi:hypothetical protein [Bifidobacterium imperatoris]|uniref:DNA-binding helix-turn-helix protein n=1 Tax=Bifidobacterium imperatoris TaxID=2020965 RepID=A0A2N5IT87_9BIFI|nr:hypothetical protein [Bifidobacterium imperatoris]PLS25168.1 DNA-binding helix-turn-helix protein [Bifidobacterium imperatoris]